MTSPRINSRRAPEPVGPYPHARRVGNLLFLSGVGPRKRGDKAIPGVQLDDQGQVVSYDIEVQCRLVFENVRLILEEAGSCWNKLVDITVFLTNLEKDFSIYNRLYGEYFKGNQPCRTTVGISRTPDADRHRVEMHRDHRLTVNAMRELKPFNFREWIDKNRGLLKPPVCNKLVFEDAEFMVMVVGGPNNRKDYHYDEGEEFFYQIEGDMVLKIMEDGSPKDIRIREGDIFLLPPHIPHSPQRFADTVGMVIERKRHPEEQDGLLWYCDNCANLLYEEYFHLRNVETDFPPVFERFYARLENRTCKRCGMVMENRNKKC